MKKLVTITIEVDLDSDLVDQWHASDDYFEEEIKEALGELVRSITYSHKKIRKYDETTDAGSKVMMNTKNIKNE